jgi:hypothetical protein
MAAAVAAAELLINVRRERWEFSMVSPSLKSTLGRCGRFDALPKNAIANRLLCRDLGDTAIRWKMRTNGHFPILGRNGVGASSGSSGGGIFSSIRAAHAGRSLLPIAHIRRKSRLAIDLLRFRGCFHLDGTGK